MGSQASSWIFWCALATLWRLIVTPFWVGSGSGDLFPLGGLRVLGPWARDNAAPGVPWDPKDPESPCVLDHITKAEVIGSQHETSRTRRGSPPGLAWSAQRPAGSPPEPG